MITVWRSLTSVFRGRAPREPNPNERAWAVVRLLDRYIYRQSGGHAVGTTAMESCDNWDAVRAALADAKRAAPQRFNP